MTERRSYHARWVSLFRTNRERVRTESDRSVGGVRLRKDTETPGVTENEVRTCCSRMSVILCNGTEPRTPTLVSSTLGTHPQTDITSGRSVYQSRLRCRWVVSVLSLVRSPTQSRLVCRLGSPRSTLSCLVWFRFRSSSLVPHLYRFCPFSFSQN